VIYLAFDRLAWRKRTTGAAEGEPDPELGPELGA
jgi:hypothetical protein